MDKLDARMINVDSAETKPTVEGSDHVIICDHTTGQAKKLSLQSIIDSSSVQGVQIVGEADLDDPNTTLTSIVVKGSPLNATIEKGVAPNPDKNGLGFIVTTEVPRLSEITGVSVELKQGDQLIWIGNKWAAIIIDVGVWSVNGERGNVTVDAAKLGVYTVTQVDDLFATKAALSGKLDANGKAADSFLLEGKTKAQVIAEARSGLATQASVLDLETELAGKLDSDGKAQDSFLLNGRNDYFSPEHLPTWEEVTGKPTSFASTWDQVGNKPATYPPATHNHDSSYVKKSGDIMTGALQINGLHTNAAVDADAFKASGYGIMTNRSVMYLQNANADGKVSIGISGAYGQNIKLSVGKSNVESTVPVVVKGPDVSITPSSGHASLNMSTAANYSCTIRMREDANKHGAYIQYDGASSNALVLGTYQDGVSSIAVTIPRGNQDVHFEKNIGVKGGLVNLASKFRLVGETNGVKVQSVANGKNAWFGARNADWFHIETDANNGFYSYDNFNIPNLTVRAGLSAVTVGASGANSGQGIVYNGKTAIGGANDSWLRLNPHGQFPSGTYFENQLVRTDGMFTAGSWSGANQAVRIENNFYDSSWGNNGVAAYSVNKADSTGAHWAFASYYDSTNIRAGIQILTNSDGRMRFYTNRRSNYVEVHSGQVFAGSAQSTASNAYTRKDYVDSKVAALSRSGEVVIGNNAPRGDAGTVSFDGLVWGYKNWNGLINNPFNLVQYISAVDGFKILVAGYYEIEWTDLRRRNASGDSPLYGAILKGKTTALARTNSLTNDYDATPITCRWVGKLAVNDTIQLYSAGASVAIEGGHFVMRYIKP